MSINFDAKIVGIWYVSTIPNSQDWMGALREIVPDKKYELKYRFRYYNDEKIFDSEDKRNWYEGICTGTKNYCVLSIRSVAAQLAKAANDAKVYEVLNEGDYDNFLSRFEAQPFVFMRKVSPMNDDDIPGISHDQRA
jgi:hypothetical protein